jgi:hypothetical protein
MASFSEAPRERASSRGTSHRPSLRTAVSVALVVFIVLVALGFVR